MTSYSWDFENRLVSVALPGTGGTVSFKYDPFGRRIQKSSVTGITVFAYDGDNLLEELSATGLVAAQYTQSLGIDEPLAMYRAGAVNFYHADGLGSISALTDTTGTPAAAYVYDSFGNTFPAPGSVTNPFRYTAREFDSETGLYYYRARYYDPGVGRFLSEDPVRHRAGVNFYRYVRNNPVSLVDPLGLGQSGAAIGGVIGGILGGILGAGGGLAGGTLVAPGVGTIAGGIEGGVEGVTVGATVGAAIGAAVGNQIENLMKEASSPACKTGQVQCWFSGEFKDPSIDPKFKMCTYSCSDGTARVAVIHIALPCPRDPARIPGFLK